MPNQYRSGTKFHDISAIDSRLADLEQEKQQLIALRAELQKSKPTPPISGSFSPEQKIAIFRNLFRGRTDILPIIGKTNEDEVAFHCLQQ